MTKVDANQAQNRLTEIINSVGDRGDRVVIEQEGKAVAAIISYEDLKRLEALEDVRDAEMMRRTLAEHQEFVTLEEVIANYNKLHGTDFTIESILNDSNDEVYQNL
ncbi:type II toxin-antitoxin system Phd/YefM family antitoxin [Floridanema evergladense]|uniref:Antitoxin n=1 Tax=Floridaenema evergladense BLCC-F167 TaxID=3153639 RepID=A0ABV4WT68_9CYAN